MVHQSKNQFDAHVDLYLSVEGLSLPFFLLLDIFVSQILFFFNGISYKLDITGESAFL